MTSINPHGPLPKYHQLHSILSEVIAGELVADDPFPSERELQDRYELSRMTVRKAVDQLVAEGKLYRVAGRGTFVSAQRTNVPVQLSSFTEDMIERGMEPSQRLYSLTMIKANPQISRELSIDLGDQVVLLNRLRLADARPICFEQSYIPAKLIPGFQNSWTGGSLFAYLHNRYDIRPTWSEQVIGACVADSELANALELPVGSALLRVRQHAYHQELLVEYCVSNYRPDRYELSITLQGTAAPRAVSRIR